MLHQDHRALSYTRPFCHTPAHAILKVRAMTGALSFAQICKPRPVRGFCASGVRKNNSRYEVPRMHFINLRFAQLAGRKGRKITPQMTSRLPFPPASPHTADLMLRQYELVERVLAYDPHADEAMLNRAYVYTDRKSTRLNSSHPRLSRMPSSA